MMVVHTLDLYLTLEHEIRHLGFSKFPENSSFLFSNNHCCGNLSLFLCNIVFYVSWINLSMNNLLLFKGIDFDEGDGLILGRGWWCLEMTGKRGSSVILIYNKSGRLIKSNSIFNMVHQ